MGYQVKEIFYTLQGEGAHSGRAAVFCRFAGCNLWSGRETDRASAQCQFCDTQFIGTDGVGGGRFSDALALASAIAAQDAGGARFVVLTGGEPLLQVDGALVAALHERGYTIALETNGTLVPPEGIDWVCVSPKIPPNTLGKNGERWQLQRGNELKLVWPQTGFEPQHLQELLQLPFQHHFLQALDDANRSANTAACVAACMANPAWHLSVQTHKVLGIA